MSKPIYTGTSGQTLVYAASSSAANFTDVTTMGASPLGTTPRLVPDPSPAYNSTTVDTTHTGLVAGKNGTDKAFTITYTPTTVQQGWDLAMMNGGTFTPDVVHYIRVPIKITGHLDSSSVLAIKYFRFVIPGMPFGGGYPQWSTHDRIPWSTSGMPSAHNGTFFEAVCGNNDSLYSYPTGSDQGIQPIGPYTEDMLAAGNASGSFFTHTYGYRSHQAALSSDGVTKQTVAITGNGSYSASAVFSESQVGKIQNGQFISIKAYAGVSGGGAVVSNFDGNQTCTLTAVNQASGSQYLGGTQTTNFAIDLNGLMRQWINDTLIMDVSKAGLNTTPLGGEKQYCGIAQLSMIPVDMGSSGTYGFYFGGVQTQPMDGTSQITMTYNLGSGDPTNLDTLTWWTAPYTGSTIDHLLVTTSSVSGLSGVPLNTQPVVNVTDANGVVILGTSGSMSVKIVTGSATIKSGSTTSIVNGVANFSGLTLSGFGDTRIQFSTGSVTSSLSTISVRPKFVTSSATNVSSLLDLIVASVVVTPGTISLSPATSSTTVVGTAYNAENQALPNQVYFRSSDTTVATVNKTTGLVQRVSTGTVQISGSITDPSATHLAVTRQPSGSIAGLPIVLQPIVAAYDIINGIDTAYTGSVTASLNVISGTPVLSGSLFKTCINGVATFISMSVSGSGTWTMNFTAPGLVNVTSSTVTTNNSGPVTLRADTFNRADNSSTLGTPSDGGSSYLGNNGTFGISGSQAYPTLIVQSAARVLEAGAADCTVTVTLAAYDPGGSNADCPGIAFRSDSGVANYWLLRPVYPGFWLDKFVAGTPTNIAQSSGVTYTNGDVLSVQLSGNSIVCKLNGVALTNLSISDATYNTNTKHGIGISGGSSNSRWENLTIVSP